MLADGGPVRAPQRSIFTPTAVSSRGDVASRPVVEQTSNKFFLKHQHSSKTSYQVPQNVAWLDYSDATGRPGQCLLQT